MDVLQNERRHLPPRRGLDVIVVVGRPPGPVGGIERNELLGLSDRDGRQLRQVDVGGPGEHWLNLWITHR